MEKETSVSTKIADLKQTPDSNIDGELQQTVIKRDVPVTEETPKPPEQVRVPETAPSSIVKLPTFQIKFPDEENRYIKMLVYGDYGVGKTYFAGTAQDVKEMKNVINIDAEGGNKVLANRGDIPSIRVKKFSELRAIFEYLKVHCTFRDSGNKDRLIASEAYYRGVPIASIKKPIIYNTVMIDSISEVARYCMYDLLGIDVDTVGIGDILPRPEFKEWNGLMEQIRLLIRKFRELPMHVIFVASRQWDKDEQQRQLFTPNIQGKLANEIQGFMDHVGYYTLKKNEANEVHRYLILQPGETYQAKNRFVNFSGVYLQDPIMQDIYDLEVLNKSVPTRLQDVKDK